MVEAPVDADMTNELKLSRCVERFSPTPGLCIYEPVLNSGEVDHINVCCYLVPNEPRILEDELYILGDGQYFIVRHSQSEPSKPVGIALSSVPMGPQDWKINLMQAYFDCAESFLKASLLHWKQESSSQNPELVVDFQHFKSLAWLSGPLFSVRRGDEAESYWKQNSEVMLKLLGLKSRQAPGGAKIAALLQFRLS